MSKKKHKGLWDFTAEEQQEAAEQMAQLEDKKLSIFDLGKGAEAPISESGFTKDLESIIYRDILGSSNQPIAIPNAGMSIVADSKPEVQTEVKEFIPSTAESTDGIHVDINRRLNRLTIDDGVSPTTLSIDYINLIEISGDYDDSDAAQIISLLYYYIISCKHPFAVISNIEFESKFKKYKSFNENKFIFIAIDGGQCLYYIEEEDVRKLTTLPDIYHMNTESTLQFYTALAYNAGATHNIFFIDDDEYISRYKSYLESIRSVDDYIKLMDNDKDTVFHDNIPGEVTFYAECLDATYLQKNAREQLMELIGDIDDDDDDWGSDDDEDTEDETPNYSVDDINSLLPDDGTVVEVVSEVTEKVPPIENITPTGVPTVEGINQLNNVTNEKPSDDSMVIPVIKKH
jgi:hypothetical protein